MTNRIKPGPGSIGPTWKELIQSGELRPSRGTDAADGGTGSPGRKPVFGKVPSNWDDLTEAEQEEWAIQFVRAAKAASGEDYHRHPGSTETREMSLGEAIALATDAHAGMTDKAGRPYIEHPIRVMAAMGTDVERMIAVLHDVLEDTPVTVDELRTRGCPPEVVEAVEILTKRNGENYDEFIQRIRDSRNELALRVKLADIADNEDEKRLALLDPAVAQRLRSKYSDTRPLLLDKGVMPD
jgi:hypothetical protein